MKVNRYVYIILMLSTLGFTSCGAKKRNVDVSKVKVNRQNDIVLKQQNDITTLAEFTRIANTLIIEPKDSVNQLIIGKDTIQGAKKVIYKKEQENSQIAIRDSSTVDITDKSKENVETKERNVQMEREGFDWKSLHYSLILGLMLVIAIIVLILVRRKKPDLLD